mmetsp:Transcript_21231/g.51000  ORF Transcript_21231/g.51000 Transcript_21231/m.51000 type:complete len:271 (+) Transcript_21231:366-1178(+)
MRRKLWRQLTRQLLFRGIEPLEQRGWDRHAVGPRQCHDFIELEPLSSRRSPRRRHADGLMPIPLVVRVHAAHFQHARVLLWLVQLRRLAGRGRVPVLDAPRERTDQPSAELRRRHCLKEAEDEGNVARDPLFLELLHGLEPLPRPRQLDEDARPRHSRRFIHANDPARALERFLNVERKARIHLRRDIPIHKLHNLTAEIHRQPVHRERHGVVRVARLRLGVRHRLVDERRVLRVTRKPRLRDEQRVGRRVRDVPRGGHRFDHREVACID